MKRRRREASVMKFRRPASLVATFEDGEIVLHNFIDRSRFACSPEYFQFLSRLDEWHSPRELFGYFPDVDPAGLSEQLARLIAAKLLIAKGTEEAARDEEYQREWLWGAGAGFFHFSVRGTRFVTGSRVRGLLRKRLSWRRPPPLFEGNSAARAILKLPRTDTSQQPFALMRHRRSRRKFDGGQISQQVLADCLFAGNGMVDFIKDDEFGRLPLTMTPSGGARNPFELYVYAAHVKGLRQGFYHYGALNHDLGLVRAGKVPVPPMLGGQRWPAKAAAIVFLVAHFPRTMWKYHLPIAYRIVTMEAGFIGQNVALAATHHGLSAVPSGALNEALIEGYLGTLALGSAVLLSISLGKPKAVIV